ncbi:hypothetical protein ACJ73_10219, partial [Blastomyces percursus]
MFVTTNPCKYIIADNIAHDAQVLLQQAQIRRGTAKSTSTTPYNRNFQQNLIDHGVYPDGYEYPDGRIPVMPNSWEEINETLTRPRPSLSPSKFSDEHFRKFKRADTHASKEQPVTTSVIPIIEGDVD